VESSLRVQFAHGLEGSPQGVKSRLLAAHFDARTPAMDTRDFEGCVDIHVRELAAFRPHVLVGSSFGGAVVLALLQRGHWCGPTLLLAQGGLKRGLPAELPPRVPVWIVHGTRDRVIDPADSRRLAGAGDEAHVRLFEPEDDHALRESARSGDMVEWVRDLSALRANAES
jgi:predicted esterase